ncbi:non-ribosomal peptide synthetase [Actinokineospora auranticolor]|uniref:Non-ribosomal peptide synthase protein (TIGR01720 family)/amino acid adenylation domain-containing protein n=1 Tax=Actinokineospora auranticolor TaxID=155976 RepID=A0A2S6GJI2_9PSEU|nr:non-ribosomal peptide synthetase [Actinokineospora auranticolor]PPK65377.1 non-ribosomal peptide synthase protein (TIGR01720 family)/amino acid adenylation domain-containing protein [Actinokineospora auranticolor]
MSAPRLAFPTLLDLFADQVRRKPAAPALLADAGPVSYAELDDWSDRLARAMLARGAGPERLVALALPRSVEIVVAQLAVLKSGAAYLPVDPAYPAERISAMLDDAKPLLVVADPAEVVAARTDESTKDGALPGRPHPEQPAYVIYTSGSTGRPKGVVVAHRGLATFAQAEVDRFDVRPGDRVLQFSSPSFDASVLELCMAFAGGAALVVPPPGPLLGAQLAEVLRTRRVTHALIPPVALATVGDGTPPDLPDFRTLVVGGDATAADLVRRWAPGRRMINAYGPTESTVVATWSGPLAPADDSPPIGRAIPGTEALVLDDDLRPVPDGTAGELYVTGVGTARGYLDRPGLTAERFLAAPGGARMYRTGDVVRRNADGDLEFVGRADHQVKIRGFRIEPGEIEAELSADPAVGRAVVVARAETGLKRLVAYVVPGDGRPVPSALRARLEERLPAHMVPAAIVVLDAFPLTPNGKLDRDALPAPTVGVAAVDHVAPRDERERVVAEVVADVLGVDSVGVDDDFFALGGDSILAVRAQTRLASAFGTALSGRALFDARTVAALAALLPERPAETTGLPRAHRAGPLPLSPAQRRLWLEDQTSIGPVNNTGFALRLTGPLDRRALQSALNRLATRHDALRTTVDGEHQVVADAAALPVREMVATDLDAALTDLVAEPYDLARGPLTRVALIGVGPEDHVLVLAQHHIITDGWSAALLVDELTALYAEETTGVPADLPEPSAQYPDYAAWQSDREVPDTAHWQSRLEGLTPLNLPTDRPRPPVRVGSGGVHRHVLSADLVRGLNTLGTAHEATLFMTLTAAVQVLLAAHGRTRDIALGAVRAGRPLAELDRVAGFFVNTLVLRSRVDPTLPFSDFLGAVRETTLDAFDHDDVPFDRLADQLALVRDPSRTPLVQAVVALQQPLVRTTEAGGLGWADQPLPRPSARFDLAVEFWPTGDRLTAVLEYDTALFDADRIAALAKELEALLGIVAARPDTPLGTLADLPEGDAPAVPSPRREPDRYLAPRTPVEATLAAVFADVLGAARVGVRDNFFALGGDSILSIQVVTAARAAGLVLTAREVFVHQTVAALAPHVTTVDTADEHDDGPVSGPVPLTPIQRWFFDTHTAHPERFDQTCLVDLGEPVLPDALATALFAVLEHHDALRMRFHKAADWHQENAPVGETGMVAEHGPVFVAELPGPGDPDTAVRLRAHHLVVDGVSWRVLAEDLRTAHRQAVLGEEIRLPRRTTSFREWATRLAEHAAAGGFADEIEHWRVARAETSVPRDQGGPNTTASERSVTVTLTEGETEALLRAVPSAYRTQVNDVLLTAFGAALREWTRRPATLVHLEGHGREDLFDGVDLSRTVGWFTTLFPVVLTGSAEWGTAIKAVKESLRSIPRRGIGFGALRHLAGMELGGTAEVSFNYLGRIDAAGDLALDAHPDARRPHVLDVVGRVERDRLALTVYYSENLHRASTITRFTESIADALRSIVAHCAAGGHGRTPSDFPLVDLDQDTVDTLATAGVSDIWPLTPMQAGMVFHSLSQSGQGAYFQQTAFVLDGHTDLDRLADAWRQVVDRTPILRSGVVWQDVPEPLAVVRERVELPITLLDWTGRNREAQLDELLAHDRERGFDLAAPPLMRLTLARLDGATQVVWTFHHVLLDGWSVFGVLSDVAAAYAGGQLPERPDFADYHRWLAAQDPADAERHWRGVLGELAAPTPLPFDRPRASVEQPTTSARTEIALTADETTRLTRFAKEHRLTAGTVVQGAWALLLAQYSGQRQVCFGATVSGRPADLSRVDEITGMFVNTLPVVTTVDDSAVADWLARSQRTQVESRAFEHTPLTRLHGFSAVPGGMDLFDTAVIFENYPADGPELRELTAVESTTFPLSVTVYPGERLRLLFGYEPRLFDAETVTALAEHLRRLLGELVEDGTRAVTAIPALAGTDRDRVLVDWNDTAADVPDTTLVAMLAEQAARTPDAEALVAGERRWTYAQLDAEVNRVAHALVRRGAGPEKVVAVAMPRSAELVIALLAVLRAGAAYLPVDPELPRDRVEFMRVDADAVCLLETLPEGPAPTTAPEVEVTPEMAAYIIYTSGSTGRPKGVVVPHSAIVNRLVWTQARFGLGADDRVLQKTPASFDVSVWEFFWPLTVGATLVVAKADGHRDPAYLSEVIRDQRVTTVHFVPSMLRAFLAHGDRTACGSLRRVLCSGEALPADLAAEFHGAIEAELHNLYGPTEAAVDVTHWACEPGAAAVPIGRPVWNTRLHVLDADLNPVPVGAPGELFLSGVQLARGYLARPGLTAERFIADPYGPAGTRMYRTGDLVRWTRGGAVEYLGRTDQQVKIRGVRIEPGEVEAALSALPGVTSAAVIARDGKLIGYATPSTLDAVDLRAVLGRELPEHMVPAALVALDALPLTPSGKLDRRALPDPEFGQAGEYVEPDGDAEQVLADIWAEVLDVPRVGATDSFFDLGGDSITSLHVTARANAAFAVALTPRDVLTARTVRALADVVTDHVLRELEALAGDAL